MFRRVCCILLAAVLCTVSVSADLEEPETSALAAILVHPASGRVLYAKNENSPMLIASTTKLMTALVAAENLSPEESVEILPEWTYVEGSSMYLRPGERYTVRELLTGLLLASGNDAALALAGIAAGDSAHFAAKMNARSMELGLQNTHFDNPHGLDSPGQYSTAEDLAVIMRAVCAQPVLLEILGLKRCEIRGLTYENHNKLLGRCEGVFGGKTGYTKAAGRCLVSCAEREGMELICVTLSDPNDWRDHKALYDWAYGAFHEITVDDFPSVPLIGGESESVSALPGKEVVFCLETDTGYSLAYALPPFVFAPVFDNELLGMMIVTFDNGTTVQFPLYSDAGIQADCNSERVWREIVDRFMGIYAM